MVTETHHPGLSSSIPGHITLPEAVCRPWTLRLAVPRPVTHLWSHHTVRDPSPSHSRTLHPSGSCAGHRYTSAGSSRNHRLSFGRYGDQDPSPGPSQSHSWTHHPSGGCLPVRDPSPSCTRTLHPSRGCLQARDPLPGRTQTSHMSRGCLPDWDLSPSRTRTCDPSRIRHRSGPITQPFLDLSSIWKPCR